MAGPVKEAPALAGGRRAERAERLVTDVASRDAAPNNPGTIAAKPRNRTSGADEAAR